MSIVLPDRKSEDGLWLKNYTVDGKSTKTRSGRLWNSLVTRTTGRGYDRCYDVAENHFLGFNEFSEWCQKQHGYLNKESNGYYWQLDKDILVQGNKIYSPETCVFIPGKLNSLFIERVGPEGLPLGAKRVAKTERFIAQCRDANGGRVNLGTYGTPEEAHNIYLKFKATVVMEVLGMYDLDKRVVDTLRERWGYGDISREGLTRKVEQVVTEKVSYV